MKRINYILFILGIIVFSSCNDIVKYEEEYDDDSTSTGAPVIERITNVIDTESAITEGDLSQIILIQGKNLSDLISLKFNDVEVDLKDAYIKSGQISVPIPRTLPSQITDKIHIETKKGSAEFAFKVTFPPLKITGISNDFALAGDTVYINGENFDLYGITLSDGKIELAPLSGNPIDVKILSATDRRLIIQLPVNYNNNRATLSITGSNTINPAIVPLHEQGISIVNWEISAHSPYRTDGSNTGDPIRFPDVDFVRFNKSVNPWTWAEFIDYMAWTTSDADFVNNPKNYYFKFEIATAKALSGIQFRLTFTTVDPNNGQSTYKDKTYYWSPETKYNSSLYTANKWETVTFDMADMYDKIILESDPSNTDPIFFVNGDMKFHIYLCNNQNAMDCDVSVTNMRFVKK